MIIGLPYEIKLTIPPSQCLLSEGAYLAEKTIFIHDNETQIIKDGYQTW